MEKIIGVLLAAGKAKRMGTDKLALDLGGKSIGKRSLETAFLSKLDHIIVVRSTPISATLLCECPNGKWEEIQSKGDEQSSSLISGIQRAINLNAEAVVILLADQPFMTPTKIDRLINRFLIKKHSTFPPLFIAYKNYNRITPPVLFCKEIFKDLLALQGDRGARELIKNKYSFGDFIELKDPVTFMDIDTQEDYQKALQFMNLQVES